MPVTIRSSPSGAPLVVAVPGDVVALGQRYAWCSDRIDGADGAQVNLNMAPLFTPSSDYTGGGVANQLFSAQRVLRASGVAARLVGGLVTIFNRAATVPTSAADFTVFVRAGTLVQMEAAMLPELARLVIPAATLTALTGPTVPAVQLNNWTDPGGAPLVPPAELAVTGGDQFVSITVDKPVTTFMANLTIYVDWSLE